MGVVADIATAVLLATGCFFGLTGAVGILRMPDFYTRLHAAGKADSLAQTCIFLGLLCQVGNWIDGTKLLLISVFLFLTTPTATHAITQAAYLAGLKHWQREDST